MQLVSSRAWTIARGREGCEERRGILLGLIYRQQGEVLSGHSSAADSGPGLGAPWRQTNTTKELRQQKSLPHIHSKMHILSHTLPFAFTLLSFTSLSRKRRVHVKDMPSSDASCSSCQCLYFSFVFPVVFFSPFLGICRLVLVHVNAVSP